MAIEIFYFSTIVSSPIGKQRIDLIPILYHFIVFFLFSFFLFITIKGNKKIKSKYILIVIIISIIYAVLDEIHQSFVPNRDSSIKDVLIDTLGIFFSIIIYSNANSIKKSEKTIPQY